jgi:CheY-like chemotaxis protein
MSQTGRPRIALINDDTTFLELMNDLLESMEGYQVIVCKESDAAYDFVKKERPDLVLLDIRIGGQEAGWTILELLTLDPATISRCCSTKSRRTWGTVPTEDLPCPWSATVPWNRSRPAITALWSCPQLVGRKRQPGWWSM